MYMSFMGFVWVHRREKIKVCHQLGMGTEREIMPQLIVCYRTGNETGQLGLVESGQVKI